MSTGSNEGAQIDGSSRVEQAVSAPANTDSQAVTTPALGGFRAALGTLFSYVPRFGLKNAVTPAAVAEEPKGVESVPQAVEAAPELGSEEFLIQHEQGKWNPGVAGSLVFKAAVDAGMKTTEARDPQRLAVTVDPAANQVRVVIVAPQAARENLFTRLSEDGVKVARVGAPNLVIFPEPQDANTAADSAIA